MICLSPVKNIRNDAALMSKLTSIITALAFGALVLAAPHNSQAAGFAFNFKGRQFAVSAEDVAAWNGQQSVAPSNILNPPPPPFKSTLLELAGQAAQSTNTSAFYNYNLSAVYNYIQSLGEQINVPVVDPVLNIENSIVTEFTPPQDGLALDAYKTALNAMEALAAGKTNLDLTVYETAPKTDLSQTNSLGINGLIAEGTSNFSGSPKNRRWNIAVGIKKFQGVIVPQGQEFSFDNTLGPVEAAEGFLPELVIDNGTTQPEFGGGLCQVSTTAFRAAMAAGLPITDRRNHAYAVQYYSPQGTDATIYPGSADLRFINDTPGAILIWPYEKDKNTLVFDFYGSDDGRQVTLEKPVVYDKQPDGSMKATWTRDVISADGIKRADVFKSNYQSPALFHKTEQFVSAPTSTPPAIKAQ
jgi:vancomycin resistance protein YoaR